jgi:predicted glycoside hydrolase/deacetylase ChbG (UPF0249 family)
MSPQQFMLLRSGLMPNSLEEAVCRIRQMSRLATAAVGCHLVLTLRAELQLR